MKRVMVGSTPQSSEQFRTWFEEQGAAVDAVMSLMPCRDGSEHRGYFFRGRMISIMDYPDGRPFEVNVLFEERRKFRSNRLGCSYDTDGLKTALLAMEVLTDGRYA